MSKGLDDINFKWDHGLKRAFTNPLNANELVVDEVIIRVYNKNPNLDILMAPETFLKKLSIAVDQLVS